jgi:hypothetical protein
VLEQLSEPDGLLAQALAELVRRSR